MNKSDSRYPAPPPPPFAPYYYAPALSNGAPFAADPKALRKAMKEAVRMEEKQRLREYGGVTAFCCDGVAQLFWAVIFMVILGALAILMVAIYMTN